MQASFRSRLHFRDVLMALPRVVSTPSRWQDLSTDRQTHINSCYTQNCRCGSLHYGKIFHEHIFPWRDSHKLKRWKYLLWGSRRGKLPALKLLVLVVPAAAVVSEGSGPGALQSRIPLLQHEPAQRLQGWASSAEETGHQIPIMNNKMMVI